MLPPAYRCVFKGHTPAQTLKGVYVGRHPKSPDDSEVHGIYINMLYHMCTWSGEFSDMTLWFLFLELLKQHSKAFVFVLVC